MDTSAAIVGLLVAAENYFCTRTLVYNSFIFMTQHGV